MYPRSSDAKSIFPLMPPSALSSNVVASSRATNERLALAMAFPLLSFARTTTTAGLNGLYSR